MPRRGGSVKRRRGMRAIHSVFARAVDGVVVGAGVAVAGAVTSGPLVTFDDEAAASQTGLSVHLPR